MDKGCPNCGGNLATKTDDAQSWYECEDCGVEMSEDERENWPG